MKRTRPAKKQRPRRPPQDAHGPEPIRAPWSERICLAWMTCLFLLHGFGVALLFEPIDGIFNNAPVIEQDWSLHFHHLQSMATFWRQDRMLWGYNPLFMAGYPSNTIQDLSIKFFELPALAFSSLALTPIQWFKMLAFLAVAGIPWTAYFAARNFFDTTNLKNVAGLIAALIGTAYWWNSLPREMFFYGMLGYPAACYATVLGLSLFYRLARETSGARLAHVGWTLFAVAILPLHVQSLVLFVPAAAALLLAHFHRFRPQTVGAIVAAAGLAVVANLAWLAPAFRHSGDEISSAIVDQLPLFTSTDPLTFIKDYLTPKSYWSFRSSFWEKGFRLALLVSGAWGILRLRRHNQKDLAAALATGSIALFVVAYFGSLIPWVKPWQPLRFKVAYDLLLIVPAAYLLAVFFARREAAPRMAIVALLLLGSVCFAVNLVYTESGGKMHLRTRMAPELVEILEWIDRSAPRQGRVLFEESGDETGFVYDGSYLSSLVAHRTGRELIGGPLNLYNDRHHFAEFHSGKLLKRSIQTLTDDEIKDYVERYNIGAVVAFHPASLRRLQAMPGLFVLDRRVGHVHLIKVNQPLTWFIRGEGVVNTRLNRLELTGLRGDELVLKYHWIEGLAATPPAKIVPVQIGDDPIPFIKIVDPPAAVTIRVAG